jgi:protein SCO1/2
MKHAFAFVLLLLAAACRPAADRLPILGERLGTKPGKGLGVVDTVYHTIPDFLFINQDGQPVTARTFDGKIYVADFFFTTCPTICPKMQSQLLKVYQEFKGNPRVMFLSHSIDPRHDTVPVLKEYAKNLGVDGPQWQFVTGDKAKTYEIAQKSYFVSALDDKDQPGGIVHSGAFVLVDPDKRIRGLYDSTRDEDVNLLIAHIRMLLKEYETPSS